MPDQEPDVYVVRCKACNGIVYAGAASPAARADVATDIARFIRDGYRVDRVGVGIFRCVAPWCSCVTEEEPPDA